MKAILACRRKARRGLVIAMIAGWFACLPATVGDAWTASAHASNEAAAPAAAGAQAAAPQMIDIHDIKPLTPLRGRLSLRAYGLIGAAGLALMGLAICYLKRRAGRSATPDAPFLPPETVAWRQLEGIRDAGALAARVFYFRLSAILRAYIEGRYGLKAPEMTTEELLPTISLIDLPPGLGLRLRELLLSTDPIKFAALPASRTKMESDLAFAYTFVEKTTEAASHKPEDPARSRPGNPDP